MEQKKEKDLYCKCYDRRKGMYGIKICGQKDWYVEPSFEDVGIKKYVSDELPEVWFRQNGHYGLYNVAQRCIVIPATYNAPFNFDKKGKYAIVWKDYKAGAIDHNGEVVIPIIYDIIFLRGHSVSISEDEAAVSVGRKTKWKEFGYACYTNDGVAQAYDVHCQPNEFYDWEDTDINSVPEYTNREVETMSVEELEGTIRKEYICLLEMGYESCNKSLFSKDHGEAMALQEQKVLSLILDRRTKMNQSWEHNIESAHRLGRTNKLLKQAVDKAVRLGEKSAKSMQWMERTSHKKDYKVEVFIYPEWQDCQSALHCENKCVSSLPHIWNIIASMGGGEKHNGFSVCFDCCSEKYNPEYWNVRELTSDDGPRWHFINYPVYQDEYFTSPFFYLYLTRYHYSFEDICNINDFRVNVEVRLVT